MYENGNQCVSIFDKDEVFIHSFAEGQVSTIRGISVSANNDMYVAKYNNRSIQIFSNSCDFSK